jgi:hypothetical protein
MDEVTMARIQAGTLFAASFLVLLIFFTGTRLWAMDAIGVVKKISGGVLIERGQAQTPLNMGDKIFQGDTIVTGKEASVGIIFHDDGMLSLGSDTRLVIEQFEFAPAEKKLGMISRIFRGSAIYLSGLIGRLKKDSIFIKTPTATCGIRGTQIAVRVGK